MAPLNPGYRPTLLLPERVTRNLVMKGREHGPSGHCKPSTNIERIGAKARHSCRGLHSRAFLLCVSLSCLVMHYCILAWRAQDIGVAYRIDFTVVNWTSKDLSLITFERLG